MDYLLFELPSNLLEVKIKVGTAGVLVDLSVLGVIVGHIQE